MGKNESFSDRLTPGQIQTVLDSLHIPWRNHNWQGNDGWVNVKHRDFQSDLSVNVYHGGWVDQYYKAHGNERPEGGPASGDFVSLVAALEYFPGQNQEAIQYIKDVCGIAAGMKPPDVREGYGFANEFLSRESAKFVRLPIEIMESNLTSTEKLVWAVIFSHCNKGDVFSFPSTRGIGKRLGIGKSTVSDAISNLIEYGLIIEKRRGATKAPAKFPLVADTETINRTITEATKKPQGGCCPVCRTGSVRYAGRVCPTYRTELEPIELEPLELEPNSYKGKGELCPRPFSETHGRAV